MGTDNFIGKDYNLITIGSNEIQAILSTAPYVCTEENASTHSPTSTENEPVPSRETSEAHSAVAAEEVPSENKEPEIVPEAVPPHHARGIRVGGCCG